MKHVGGVRGVVCVCVSVQEQHAGMWVKHVDVCVVSQ